MENRKGNVILATASYDYDIKLWNAHDGTCAKTFTHPDSQVNALALNCDRKYLAAGGYQHVRMFDVNGSVKNHVVSYDGLSKNVTALGFHRDAKWMYTGGEDGTVKIWDIRSPNLSVARILDIGPAVNCAVLHPNQGFLYIGDQSGTIHIWEVKGEHSTQLIPDTDAHIQHLDISSDGKILAAITNKGDAYFWNMEASTATWKPIQIVKAHNSYGLKIKISPDCRYALTTSADKTAKLWDLFTYALLTTFTEPDQKWVWDAAFTSDSQHVFTASSDGKSRLWSIKTSTVRRYYEGHKKAVSALVYRDKA